MTMPTSQPTQTAEVARLLAKCQRVVALTGAGISVESGIPDFRSKGGLWTRFPPDQYATIQAFMDDPEKVWQMLAEMEKVLDRAKPNPGHLALSRLEKLGVVEGIITQNIDGLHQEAGSKTVVEFHGSHRTLGCQWCGKGYGSDEFDGTETPPLCSCGKVLKPDVVFFGEAIPTRAMNDANSLASGCRVMLVVGTSAEVVPASQMPMLAKRNGATVVEVNVERTLLTDSVTDHFLQGKAGVVLTDLANEIAKLL